MELFNTKIKILIGVVLLALIGVGVYFLTDKYSPFSGKTNKESGIIVTNIPISHLPNNFPSNLPVETGSQLLENYEATSVDNGKQSTQVYTTRKTLSENVKIYTEYLQKNGWIILSQEDKPTYKMIYASKGISFLQVDLTEQSSPLANTIGISITTFNK